MRKLTKGSECIMWYAVQVFNKVFILENSISKCNIDSGLVPMEHHTDGKLK
jgi:hypothetical protein